ncbi:MAG TPA: ABC transporter ATP-binding protein [Chloroflexi bacterium]|nr:ABC transporter ATP-binding protein [Chloroflexota bacterium]
MALLEVEKIDAGYGHIVALHGISLQVDPGEIVTLIGPNGAGKTTLLRVISGLLPARSGRVYFDGRDITSQPAEALVGIGLSHVPEHRQIFGALSVWDNLMLGAFTRRRSGKHELQRDLDFVFDLFPRLAERRPQLAGTLSGGEQQMLAIGRALMARPRLLLLDEPSLGLAPLLVRELFRVIGELRDRGVTILLVEQNARAALRVADRGYVLETGMIVLSGVARALHANPQVQQSYLGRVKREA